ncbi:TPA: SEC10/PgrA surface exclusion domain-containing protein, partial [Streptococcus suis]|nr:SEC10/PgrA surface exclusion domain-containing protein [Streptococcus suis]
MRKSIKASSLVAGVILAGVASPVLAEEVTTVADTSTENTVVTSEAVTQQAVNDAAQKVNDIQNELKVQDTIVETAQTNSDEATRTEKNAKEALELAEKASESVTAEAIQQASDKLTDAQKDKNTAQTDYDDAVKAENEASRAVADKKDEVAKAQEKVGEAEKAKSAAENALEKAEFTVSNRPTIKLSKEYIDTLKQRVEYMGDTTKGVNNSIDLGNATHVQNDAALKRIGDELFNQNTYTNTTDTNTDKQSVDLWNMTDEQRKEVNQFALDIINSVRSQLGSNQLVTTQGMLNFATDVANNRSRAYLGNDGAEYAVINNAAQKNGLSTYESEIGGLDEASKTAWLANEKDKWWNTQARQGNVVVPTKLRTEDKEKFGRTDSPDPNYQKPPVMTMGELKEEIYKGFKLQLFKDVHTGNRAKRNWEVAASLVGLGYGENVTQFSSSISVAQQSGSYEWKGVTQYYKFYSIFVNNFMIRDPQEDTYKVNTIVDPTKFDSTPLTNDPVSEAKESLGVAEKSLGEANKTLTDKKEELEKLKESLETSKKTTKDTKATLDEKCKDVTSAQNELDKLNNASSALKTAQEQYSKAHTEKETAERLLNEAVTKRTELENEYTIAKEDYEKLLAQFEASQPTITSKGDQVPPTHSLPEAKIELKEVAFATVYENDPSLELGKDVVVREGQNGSVQIISIGDQVTEIVLTEKVDKLVKRGTLVK